MGGLPGDVSEEAVTQEKRKKGWRMSCDVGETTEGLEKSCDAVTSPTSQLILQPFRRFIYVTARSITIPVLHLRQTLHLPSAALSTSQLILQPFSCFTYVTGTSPRSPGEPPKIYNIWAPSWEPRTLLILGTQWVRGPYSYSALFRERS